MSFRTWHDYGYGFRVDDIETTPEKVRSLLCLAPTIYNSFLNWAEKNYSGMEEGLENYYEYDLHSVIGGLADIISMVIQEREGLSLCICENYDGEEYVLYQPSYPWELKPVEHILKQADVEDIFRKYLKYITDKKVEITYQEVENGG